MVSHCLGCCQGKRKSSSPPAGTQGASLPVGSAVGSECWGGRAPPPASRLHSNSALNEVPYSIPGTRLAEQVAEQEGGDASWEGGKQRPGLNSVCRAGERRVNFQNPGGGRLEDALLTGSGELSSGVASRAFVAH